MILIITTLCHKFNYLMKYLIIDLCPRKKPVIVKTENMRIQMKMISFLIPDHHCLRRKVYQKLINIDIISNQITNMTYMIRHKEPEIIFLTKTIIGQLKT